MYLDVYTTVVDGVQLCWATANPTRRRLTAQVMGRPMITLIVDAVCTAFYVSKIPREGECRLYSCFSEPVRGFGHE